MISLLKILGFVLCFGLIVGIVLGKAELNPPTWSTILFGASLAAIPSAYSMNLKKMLAWIILIFSLILMAGFEYGVWTLVGFVIFGLSGVAAGLPFEADNQVVDIA